MIAGKEKTCFGVTEPNAGLNTASITTKAERTSSGYVVHGQKMWTTTAQRANKILLLARTTPKEQCKRAFDGITLFYTYLDRNKVEIREIPKMGRKAVDTNALFIDGLEVRDEDRIGEEGRGPPIRLRATRFHPKIREYTAVVPAPRAERNFKSRH